MSVLHLTNCIKPLETMVIILLWDIFIPLLLLVGLFIPLNSNVAVTPQQHSYFKLLNNYDI